MSATRAMRGAASLNASSRLAASWSDKNVTPVELPPGSRLEQTLKSTDAMAKVIRANSEVSQVFVLGGASPTGTVEPRNAAIFVNLRHRDVGLLTGILNPIITRVDRLTGLSIPTLPANGREKTQESIEAEILPKLSNIPDLRWAKMLRCRADFAE